MSMIRAGRVRKGLALIFLLGLVAAGCGDDDDDAGGGGGGGDDAVNVALLLPDTDTARYDTKDRPLFEAKIEELCPDCPEVQFSNAAQDAAEQQSQAEAALTNGADVLVLDPVDGESASAIVNLAEEQDVPVISYDRLIPDAPIDFYISHDNERVGQMQAEALVEKLEADGVTEGDIVMINGSPTDNNAALFKDGAHSVLDDSNYEIAVEYDTPEWSPDQAQAEMDQAITELGADGFVGVYAANDGTASGAISAMESAGIDPIPPTTGQDAELAAIQRILAGEQYMTIYKPIVPLAENAAEVALALARGEEIPEEFNTDDVDGVPSNILDPLPVTVDDISDTVIADEFWTVEEICTDDYADACADAGLS
jgi:D-xylose transport system substrate-binding protein